MERVFEDFSRDFGWGPPAPAGVAMAPRIDVSETDTEIKIEAELPGVDEKDVEVVLSDGRLTIKGEKKQEKEEKKKDYHMVERSYGSFARSIALPFEADPDQGEGDVRQGRAHRHRAQAAGGQGQGEEDPDRQRLSIWPRSFEAARPERRRAASNGIPLGRGSSSSARIQTPSSGRPAQRLVLD